MATLPRWNFDRLYPGLDSEEFKADFAAVKDMVARYGEAAKSLPKDGADALAAWEDITHQEIAIGEKLIVLFPYVSSFTSVNSRDAAAAKTESEMQLAMVPLHQYGTMVTAWLGEQDVEAFIAASALAKEHAFILRNSKIRAQRLMSLPQEGLAAELTLSGGGAMSELHNDVSSQIEATFEKREGETVTLPMSELRNLANDPDRDVRRRAFEAELAAWKAWETPMAAALNGVKGEHIVVNRERGWDSILDESLFQNHIDRATLDAMMGAARDAFPDLRRYWKAKARALGVDVLQWYDITAPVGEDTREWSWDEGMAFVREQFYGFSDRMGELIDRAMDEQWIDAEPRAGKAGGAFCMPTGSGTSGVLANFTTSFDSVSTMAHELGHAYHNLAAAESSLLWQENTPMTLAETASTFCETILRKAAIEKGDDDEKFAILEGGLVDAGQIVVDITSRFLFEQSIIERRANGKLSADEFSELMLDAQEQTYGDAIDQNGRHPYMWAVKGHYYSPRYAYYNYPYMFGLLFGLGLYARYQQDPDGFKAGYDQLLAETGSADAATLADRFGIDVRTSAFWAESLNVIRQDIDEFERIVNERYPQA